MNRKTPVKVNKELNIKLLKSVVDEANDAVLITHAEPIESPNGPEIIYVNRAFEKMTGYTADEVIGKTPRLLQGSETESAQLQRLRDAIQNKKSANVDVINYNKNGDQYWINISLSPIFHGDICTHFISIQRDVTDQKLREIQQKITSQISRFFNREESVKCALQLSLSAIIDLKKIDAIEFWKVDKERNTISLVSQSYVDTEKAKLYSKENKNDTFKIGEGIPGQTWESKNQEFWKNLDSEEKYIRKNDFAKLGVKTGISFPVIHNEEVLGVLVLLLSKDVNREPYYVDLFKGLSELFASEIHRKELEEQLKRIFSLSPDIICLAGNDGYFKKINPAMIEMLGYSEETLLSKPYIEFVHPEDKISSNRIKERLIYGKPVYYFENRYITKSKKIKWIAWTSTPYLEEETVLGIGKDITEQKELEELLDQANRLAKIGSWEVDIIENVVYWSEITNEIHEEEPSFKPTLKTGLEYYRDGEPKKIIQKAFDEAMKDGTPWDLELPIITGKGVERWIRTIGEAEIVNGKPIRIFGSFQDIHVRKKAELRLQERNRHIDAIASLNSSLLNYENWFEALENHMEMIGEAIQADRVYYFENRYDPVSGDGFSSQKLEWCRVGITPQLDSEDLQEMPFKDVPELVDPMIENRPSTESLSSIEYGTTTRYIMEEQGIKTFLAIPITIRDKFFGFVGFDNCTEESKWSDEEVRTLTTITSNLAVAIERYLVEKERQELLGERNIILESISDAFYAIDRNWEITYFNNEAENLLGIKAEEVIGNRFWDVFAPARETELFDNYQEVMNQKVPKAFEYFYPLLESWYDISAYPAENGISVYFKNIDDKIKTQKRILEKTRQLDAIAYFNGLLIKEEGWQEALDKCLEKFCKLAAADRVYFFEYTKVEETGQDVVSMKMKWVRDGINPQIDNPNHQNHPVDIIRKFINTIIRDGGYTDIVSEIKEKNFAEFLAGQDIKSILAVPVFSGKEFRGFIGFDDCTAERSWTEDEVTLLKTIAINLGSAIENEDSERRLIELNQSLEKQTKELANSNSELEKFAYIASHDLQEPLRMITGFLAQIERKYEDILDDKGKQYIHFATDGAKRMRQIIQDLLEYSRVGRVDMKREEVDMNEVLQNVIILQRKVIEEKSAEVKWEAMPIIKGNKGSMQQLFLNLIQNALNYQKKENKPSVDIWSEEAEKHWKFYVKDNGIGIDPKYSDKIFAIFQRLHRRDEYSGTGVGLAICKKIVEDHGGTIGVDTDSGSGSTFYFTIEKNIRDDSRKQ